MDTIIDPDTYHGIALNDKTSVSNVLNIYRFALILEGVFFFEKPDVLINM